MVSNKYINFCSDRSLLFGAVNYIGRRSDIDLQHKMQTMW